TYAAGSSSNGVVVYDDGLFVYSNHGTDPAGDKMLNAFDLVRIHMFGHLDETKAERDSRPSDLPSFKAMMDFAKADIHVIDVETAEFVDAFDDLGPDNEAPAKKKKKSKREREDDDLLGPGPEDDDKIPKIICLLNKHHAVALISGKTVVLTEGSNGETD